MRTSKRFFMVVTFMGLGVGATAQTWNCGTQGENVTATLRNDTLFISGSGDMEDFTESSPSPWGRYLLAVVVEDSVTSIGTEAFNNCFRLGSLSISNSVTRIGNRAFKDCWDLTSITIPNSVTKIEECAFFIVSF